MPNRIDDEVPLVTCSDCSKQYALVWESVNDDPETVRVFHCQSGGVYGVTLTCPHCSKETDL